MADPQLGERRPEPDLKGRLGAFTFSDILQLMSLSGQTGTLTLSQGWNTRTITFEEGRITYIAAAARLHSLEELLLRVGKVTPNQMRAAQRAAEAPGKSAVDLLIEQGVITEDDVRRVREQQLEDTVYSLFLWRRCEFTFHSGLIEKKDGIPVDLAGERVVMEGTRRVDEWIAIAPVVPSVRVVFRRVGSRPRDLGIEERLVWEQVDGVRDVVGIARAVGLTQFDTAKCLYTLAQRGHIRANPPDKVKVIELFNFLVESMYLKLSMFGYPTVALEFERQLNAFAVDHALKVRLRGGRIISSDMDSRLETTTLIDLYRLFIGIEHNKLAKLLPPEQMKGLVEGMFRNLDRDLQDMMLMYDFIPIEGIAIARAHAPAAPGPSSR